jgi:hypothetical protein
MVLARLSTAGMTVDISKSKFFAEQIGYLGYWITRQGIQPIRNKVEMKTNLSGWENNSISNIEFPMPTALIFKEQAKVRNQGIKRKGINPTSLLNTTYWREWYSFLQR